MDPQAARPLRILQLAAEVTPFAKTGGLGDVVSGLSRFLDRGGHDVRIFLPFYPSLASADERYVPVDFIRDVPVQLGPHRFTYTARTALLPKSEVNVYFIDCPELFGRGGIYHGDRDDSLRFALLTVAAFECAQRMGWSPDILHCHDWHTALAPIYRKTLFQWDGLFQRTKTVLTIHNLGFQGIVDPARVADLGLAPFRSQLDLSAGHLNFMKNGILAADALTAVSRTFAREIQTPEEGFGLDGLLRTRHDRLVGIVNGVDYDDWNPESDPNLFYHYSAADIAGKHNCKRALLREIGFDERTAAPVVGIVSRLTPQKGFDLCFETLPAFLAQRDMRLVALGSGEPMPSKFEPCGLNQMYSLRYGTPPVVRKTGGLADTVEPFDLATGQGTGFVFEHFTPLGLGWALDQALTAFHHHPAWETLMANGMRRDFSWDVQGREYEALYGWLAG